MMRSNELGAAKRAYRKAVASLKVLRVTMCETNEHMVLRLPPVNSPWHAQ